MQIYHGKIISLDARNNIYSYLVEHKGRIIYLGDSLPQEYQQETSVTELGNRGLLPSFADGHLHFSNWAMFAAVYFDVRKAKDIPEIQDIIKTFVAQHGKLKSFIPFGVSKHCVKEKRLITREELDEACPDKPLIIICYDGHSVVFNTKMIEKFPDIVKNANGYYKNEGHLFNEAYLAGTDSISSLVPPSISLKVL